MLPTKVLPSGLRGLHLQLLVAATGGCALLLMGYDQGVMGGLLGLAPFLERLGHPSPTMQGFVTAIYDVGCLLGAALCFLFAHVTGRRWTIAIGCFVLWIGAGLQTSAFTLSHFVVGRIVAGLGVGAMTATVPMYISECSPARYRGKLLVLEMSIVVIGIVISNYTNYGLVFHAPSLEGSDGQWRSALGIQMIFPVFVLALLPFCPESPRYLASKGASVETVAEILAMLEGKNATPTSSEIVRNAMEIVDVAEHEAELQTSWKETFGGGEMQNGRRLFLAFFVIGLIQQLCGINAIVYYAPIVFSNAGLSPEMSFIMGGVGSIALFIGTLLSLIWVDRGGRRLSMILSTLLSGITMGGIGGSIGYGINHPQSKTQAGQAAAFFIVAYQFFFGFGLCTVPYIYAPEVNSLRARHKGGAVQSMALWGGCFLVVMVTPPGVANLSWKFYMIWMVLSFAWAPLIWAFAPETKGRSLEQMDYFFAKYQDRYFIGTVANEWITRETVYGEHELSKVASGGAVHREYEDKKA